MSPSWREALRVDVAAGCVRVRRYSRGWRPRLLDDRTSPLAQPAPEAVGPALGSALEPLASGARRVHVVLSSDWVHVALLDGAGALRGAQERQAAAAHALGQVFGTRAATWQVCAGLAGSGTLVAAGIERALLESTLAQLARAGAHSVAIEPALVQAVNRCRRWLSEPAWLVSLEPGLATLVYSDGHRLRSLRCHRVRRSLHDELPVWLEQAHLTGGWGAPDAPVTVAYCGVQPAHAAGLGSRARMVRIDDAPAAP